jgi:hypothetical protein
MKLLFIIPAYIRQILSLTLTGIIFLYKETNGEEIKENS